MLWSEKLEEVVTEADFYLVFGNGMLNHPIYVFLITSQKQIKILSLIIKLGIM